MYCRYIWSLYFPKQKLLWLLPAFDAHSFSHTWITQFQKSISYKQNRERTEGYSGWIVEKDTVIDQALHQFLPLLLIWTVLPNLTFNLIARFPYNICNGCGMPTEDAYSSGHLVLSHFGTCKCSNVETNVSLACLASGLLRVSNIPRYFCCCFGKTSLKNLKTISKSQKGWDQGSGG